MLIDSNAHIGHWPFRQRSYNTLKSLLPRMEEFGVSTSIVSNLSAVLYKNTQTANTELYEEIRSSSTFRDRFIPFAVINPIYGGWKDDFDTCVNRYDMRGIRLYPKYHGYDLKNPFLIELVEMARDKNIVVSFVTRVVDNRPSSWMDISEEWPLKEYITLMKNVPEAKFLIQNIAQGTSLEADDLRIVRAANLVMDTSGRSISNLGELLQTFGDDKFAFGTHAPILDYCTGLLRIEALREEEANEVVKEKIRSGNISHLLNLS